MTENRCSGSKDTYHCSCWNEGKPCCYCELSKEDLEEEKPESAKSAKDIKDFFLDRDGYEKTKYRPREIDVIKARLDNLVECFADLLDLIDQQSAINEERRKI